MRQAALATLLLAVLCPARAAPAAAEEAGCGTDTVGQVACIGGRLCACRFSPGSPAMRLPDGFRWDCGILRPACVAVPATLDPYQGPLPEALSLDRSGTIITGVSGDHKDTGRSAVNGHGRGGGERQP